MALPTEIEGVLDQHCVLCRCKASLPTLGRAGGIYVSRFMVVSYKRDLRCLPWFQEKLGCELRRRSTCSSPESCLPSVCQAGCICSLHVCIWTKELEN